MPIRPDGSLSEGELAVLELLGDGLSNREIATRLVVSEATVRTHVAHLFDKLDVRDRRKLGRAYRHLQSLPPDIHAVLESRQPVPRELRARVQAFLIDLDLASIDHARHIYRLAIIRSG